MEEVKAIGRAVREARTGLGLNQRDLADLAGVSERTVRALETGVGNPGLAALVGVARVLGLRVTVQ